MSLYLGTDLLAGIATNTISNGHDLFDFKWTDHELTDQSWLRADTFSWQDGNVYSNAYNHLVADNSSGTSQTETVGSYTITYVLATDGHKITTDETNVANIYDESGVAWYYILDTTNQRFKLPRTKYGFVGLRDAVGKYVPESLPNITGATNTASANNIIESASGALGGINKASRTVPSNGSRYDLYKSFDFDASRSSPTYQNNAPVQQRATQMYLYFYVGQFSQSATEQTAGLNASLFNGKVDLNAANLSTQGKSLISGLGMPSNTYEDLTLLASGQTYTAPANGYFSFFSSSVSNSSMHLDNGYFRSTVIGATGYPNGNILPVLKGDVVVLTYSASGTLRFYYAKGSESEAS